ncbi:sensor histidine kinase [Heliobacterium mobile]|nr:ATP-binding protein [Heliobacterium mobile]
MTSMDLKMPAQAGDVMPELVKQLQHSGIEAEVIFRCSVIVLWQLSMAGVKKQEPWQGRISKDHHRLLLTSRVDMERGSLPPLSAPIFDRCCPNGVTSIVETGSWELQISLGTEDSRNLIREEKSESEGWPIIVDVLQQMIGRMNQMQKEVADLTQELLLTSQGVIALVQEMQCNPDGSTLEERVKANKELVRRLQEKEKALQQADRLATIGRLVAGVAHEINNPLTFIKVNSELLRRYLAKQRTGDPLEEEILRANQAIFRGVDRIAAIVSGLKYFSRQERGEKGPVRLVSCLQDAWMLVSSDSSLSKHARLFGDIPDDLIVRGNAQQLEQVLINLMHNSLKAIQRGEQRSGELTVRAGYDQDRKDRVIIEVCDNGCGISAAELSKVFEPFYTNDNKGTGLGLSIVQGIITEHGGTITVSSDGDSGTTFTIQLPAGRLAEGDSP